MINNINIYGSIGYVFLSTNNNDMPEYILLLADMHSQLTYCKDFKKISEWFNSKFNKSNILLEEVPRINNMELKGLFEDADHTKELKELYLNNTNIINGVDIRPYLISFSWELLNDENKKVKLSEYLKLIDNFFIFKNEKIKEELGDIYSFEYIKNKSIILRSKLKFSECDIVKLLSENQENRLNIHFSIVRCLFKKFKNKYKNYLNYTLYDILQNNKNILEEINYHLNNIMELYIILKIFSLKKNKKNIIIHTGLFHSEKILDWLNNIYNYNIISTNGVNSINNINNIVSGCLTIPKLIDDIF